MTVANIVIEQTAYSFDKPYSYIIPDKFNSIAKPGCRVIVPFGCSNSGRQGLIISISECDEEINYKELISVLDVEPILNDELLAMCIWMHDNLFCTYFDAIKSALPTGISFKVNDIYTRGETPFVEQGEVLEEFFKIYPAVSSDMLLQSFDFLTASKISKMVSDGSLLRSHNAVRRMGDASLKSVRPLIDRANLDNFKLTLKQKSIMELIFDAGNISIKEIIYFTGVSVSVISSLEKKGLIETYQKEVYRTPNYELMHREKSEIVLTDEQQNAFDGLYQKYKSNEPAVSLLYGVTGSGKTSVFLKLVETAVADGKGAIVMVPEISLTHQTISKFGSYFGNKIAVLHSALSLGQKMDEFRRIARGEAQVVIGTRSAIFAPVKNLSLIIIDEEQEHTYKSERSPRFHARDLAKFRTKYNNSLLVLASATPAIETYSAAMSGKYSLSKLSHRFGNAILPEVRTVDMRRELVTGNTSALSRELNTEIYNALQNEKQAIVLLNRRGHNTYVSCPTCNYVATCPNCSVTMTYHSANGRILCHYCGYSEAVKNECPSCKNAKLRFMGIGTQRVEEELKATFPEARILRLDADSTTAKDSISKYLDDFSKGEYDIMLGTQMVAKGLDFPNVTVVGVLGADSATNSSDYRSFERSFSLLTQVLGRAGRGEDKGIAIIQTTDPNSSLIKLASSQDYDSFYEDEIRTRKLMIYPPFCDISVVVVSSLSRELANETILEVFANIKKLIETEYSDVKLIILGPSSAGIAKLNNRYRTRIIIKSKNNRRFREMLKAAISIKLQKDTNVYVDINPENIL